MQFYSPHYLYALLGLIPLLGLAFWGYWRRRQLLGRFADKLLGQALTPLASGKKYLVRDLLLLLAGASLLLALARPQLPSSTGAEDDSKGIEAMICLDISNSMLSEDIAPSRLAFAKRTIAGLLDQMKSDRVGLIIFAGSAYVQLPITSDLGTAREFLSDIHPRMISDQGTAIGDAIQLARQSFSDRRDLGKAILILTDVEDFEEGSEQQAKDAAKAGIRVEVIGIGTEQGAPIPTEEGNLTDEAGELVVTRLDAEKGQQIAEAGGGSFIASTSQATILKEVASQLADLPRASLTRSRDPQATELFAPFLLLALALLLLEFFIMGRKNKFLMRHNIFQRKALLLGGLLLLTAGQAQGQSPRGILRQARKLYLQKDYAQASKEYHRALLRDSLSGAARFGLAGTAYEAGRYDEAKGSLERALQDPRLTPRQQADALHNLGNVAMQKKDYASAVRAYRESLIRNPENEATRYNLALAQKLLQQHPPQQNQQQDQQQDNSNNSQQQQQQQQPEQKPEEKKKEEKKNDQPSQPQEQRQGQLTKEQAEQLLRSFRADDEKTRQRVEQKQREGQQSPNKNKKRW